MFLGFRFRVRVKGAYAFRFQDFGLGSGLNVKSFLSEAPEGLLFKVPGRPSALFHVCCLQVSGLGFTEKMRRYSSSYYYPPNNSEHTTYLHSSNAPILRARGGNRRS